MNNEYVRKEAQTRIKLQLCLCIEQPTRTKQQANRMNPDIVNRQKIYVH